MEYTLNLSDECYGEENRTIEADTLEEAIQIAEEELEEWVQGGDWGIEGASVNASWTLIDENDNEESGHITVEIEPDEEALIKLAGGDTECDHQWSSKGEGGCDQNPGVWSTGGTSFTFKDHCEVCGLQRTRHVTGCQKNPGEHDTVEFYQPTNNEDEDI